MNLNRKTLLVGASLIGLAIGVPANAQDAEAAQADSIASAQAEPAGAQDDAGASTGVGDIVVIARRREEASQDVPMAINAVSGEQLENNAVRSVEDLRMLVPGVNIGGQRRDEAQFFIRGQGPGVITTGQRNFTSVATYFAEVPTSIAGAGSLYDLESVQVLKGPQGTLFGRNTTGGAVLFQPARPSAESGGYAKASYGNYNYTEFEGMVNVANESGNFAVRLAGMFSRRDGYTRSVVTGQDLDERDVEGMRLSVLVKPFDGVENLTIVDYRAKDGASGSAILRAVNPGQPLGAAPITFAGPLAGLAPLFGVTAGSTIVVPVRVGGVVPTSCLSAPTAICPTGPFGTFVASLSAAYNGGVMTNPANSGFYTVASTAALNSALATQQALGIRQNQAPSILRSKALDWGITNKTTIDVSEDITLKNIIAFRTSRKNEAADYDGTPLSFLNNHYVTSQEFGTGSEQFTEEFQIQGQLPTANLSYIVGFYHESTKPGFLQSVPGVTLGTLTDRRSDNKDTSNAVFAHFEWNPTDFIGLSGGVRQTWDERSASLSIVYGGAPGVCADTSPQIGALMCNYSAKFDALTYDATVNVRPMDNVLLFGSYRHGYKSGGINLPAPAGFETFNPEEVDSFEIGLKADWDLGVPIRTNLSLFHDDYTNMQVQQSVLVGGSASSIVLSNVTAVNQGVEFEATVVPIRGFNLSGFVSYLDSHSKVDVPGSIIKDRQLQSQPKWKYGVNAALNLPMPDDNGELNMSASWSWQDEVNTLNVPGLVPTNPSYGLLGARIEWSDVGGHGIDLAVFGTNLTDKEYVLGGYPISVLGFDSAFYGEPRMYGGSLTVHFGGH